MESEWVFHSISESDFPILIDLFTEFAAFEKRSENMINTLSKMQRDKDWIEGLIVVSKSGKIAGYTTWYTAYHTWTGKCLHIDDLYLKPEFRGAGLGTLLINKVIHKAKELNSEQLRWQVSDWNESAKNFYKSLGAEIHITEENCVLQLK